MSAASGPTDLQLEAIVRHLARLHLEIERGVRDPRQLTRLMSPQAEQAWQHTRARNDQLAGGPARDADLGAVHLRRRPGGDVLATISTTTRPGRRGALTFVLHTEGRTVTIRQATRLLAGRNYGRTINDTSDRLLDRLDRAIEERRLVIAALEAAQLPTIRGSAAPSRNVETWSKLLGQLDDEITTLMKTDLLRHFHTEPLRRA